MRPDNDIISPSCIGKPLRFHVTSMVTLRFSVMVVPFNPEKQGPWAYGMRDTIVLGKTVSVWYNSP